MKSLRIALLISIVAMLVLAVPASAAPSAAPNAAPQLQEPAPNPYDIGSVLAYLTTAGGIGVFISFFLEQRQWFQKLTANNKMLAVLAASIVIPLGAKLLLDFVPANVIEALNPYFKVAAIGFGAFIASQWYHGNQPAAKG